jgi:menaquinone-dependent protoporphyrinogen oxidase
MSKVLVVFGTKTGATQDIAEWIGAEVSETGHEVTVASAPDAPPPDGFEAVIVGSGVRAGNWHSPVTDWVVEHADRLRELPVAFFTVGMTMATQPERADEVRAWTDALIEKSGVEPIDIGLFAGMNEPKRFSLPERLILKAMKVPEGDFRDEAAVRKWARKTAGKVGLA